MDISDLQSLEINSSVKDNDNTYKKDVLNDLFICMVSREASLIGRKEVLNGRAKFGIFGDGKEVPQVAMARAFKKGDWRSGYYRDQTFIFARGIGTVEEYFSQLYADADNDPFSGGRQMNNHFATRLIEDDGDWLNQTQLYNVSSDISPTGGQMARALGLAIASNKYRVLDIPGHEKFSNNGNEISHVTIGDASTSEGVFWETINAAAVMKVPLIVSVWDDGYGISVPTEMQTTKGSISKALEGFLPVKGENGIMIYTVKGWDYPALCAVYEKVTMKVRETHTPALIHVQELTQPQGHSTSGSHERYKSKERLDWEKDMDCIHKMSEWIIESGIATSEEVKEVENRAIEYAKNAKDKAWKKYNDGIKPYLDQLKAVFQKLPANAKTESILKLEKDFTTSLYLSFSEVTSFARKLDYQLKRLNTQVPDNLSDLISKSMQIADKRYFSNLHSNNKYSALNVAEVPPKYGLDPKTVTGHQVLNSYFDKVLETNPAFMAFGEDVGKIGGVNQSFAGLQSKYGEERVFDTGIREWTIIGQAIGAAMRGLRPVSEIQYLDYLAYAFSVLSDDLATLKYRSNGIQRAPLIVRTRGHRLEGIWHTGSPMGMILNSMKGIYLCVPRNMVQAAGFYNTLLKSDEPGIIVESLNGFRLKEKLPENLLEMTVPLGKPEILQEGTDITLVTYGSSVREAEKGIELLNGFGISVELIDAQTLMPFDLEGVIVNSLKKTNRIIFMDEDVEGGATAFMMREVLEKWNGYKYLDSKPVTLTQSINRSAFGSDGDYFCKPNPEDVFDTILAVMKETDPGRFPY